MNRAMERSEIGANFGGEWVGWAKDPGPAYEPVGQEAHRKLGFARKKFLWRKERNLGGGIF